jgi:hypothetical protein
VTAELFQEERNIRLDTLVTEISEPVDFGASTSRLALAARNQPLNPLQVQSRQRA